MNSPSVGLIDLVDLPAVDRAISLMKFVDLTSMGLSTVRLVGLSAVG